MPRRSPQIALLTVCLAPMAVFAAQAGTQDPKAEEVFQNIQVFKGQPAHDVMPAMEFMSASLGFKCADCHDLNDYAKETPHLATARKMVLMQREINEKNFQGRLEVTCMTCHNGKEHPETIAFPPSTTLRHERLDPRPKPTDLFASHIKAAGKDVAMLTRTGTLTGPNDVTHKEETKPLEMVQAQGGKYRMISGDRNVGSNGKDAWYGLSGLFDEPAATFARMGRTWRGDKAFEGLTNMVVTGKDKVNGTPVVVVRARRASTLSNEELYFDSKTGLLLRAVNVRPCSIGTVVSRIDFSNYKDFAGTKAPMKVVVSFSTGDKWTMDFKTAKTSTQVDDKLFVPPTN